MIEPYILSKSGEEVERDMQEGLENQPKETFVWDDFDFSVNNLRINPNTSKPDYDEIEGEYLFDDSTTETVIGNKISKHKFKIYKSIGDGGDGVDVIWKPHVHWAQTSAGVVVWELEYKLWAASQPEPNWTPIVAVDPSIVEFPYVSGSIHQISELPDINMNAISSTAIHAKIRVSRLGGNAADTYSGDARFLGFDFHVPIDQIGSRQVFIK